MYPHQSQCYLDAKRKLTFNAAYIKHGRKGKPRTLNLCEGIVLEPADRDSDSIK